MTGIEDVRRELAAASDPDRAAASRRYLQMGPGGYGEGDDTLGVRVPVVRAVARRHWREVPVADAAGLLATGRHEERLCAIFLLIHRFEAGDASERTAAARVVLDPASRIDNWDLVDTAAPRVLGPWLLEAGPGVTTSVLERLVGSESVWERRTAVMATFAFLRAGDFTWTFRLCEQLLGDRHDLIHKASGWMLREVGNRDRAAEEAFLVRHHAAMPRVMLRYAIEKFEPSRRQAYLTGVV